MAPPAFLSRFPSRLPRIPPLRQGPPCWLVALVLVALVVGLFGWLLAATDDLGDRLGVGDPFRAPPTPTPRAAP